MVLNIFYIDIAIIGS